MKKLLIILMLAVTAKCCAQSYILKPGDHFPDLVISPLLNAPVKEVYLNHYNSKKYFILNFWGTWCSPCIPEMDTLAKLQHIYSSQIQVIAISNEEPGRLKKYLLKKPSGIWLASDSSTLLYNMFNLSYVGQSAIIDANHHILALVKTDSINSKFIKRLINGGKISSNAQIADPPNKAEKDVFGVDSLMTSNFTVRSYMKGEQTMGKGYAKGPYAGRRKSYFNVCPSIIYKDAYDINSVKQMVYENLTEKEVCDFSDKDKLYCVDLLVSPWQKDSLKVIMQHKLQSTMAIKARTETRTIPVYILKATKDSVNMPLSVTAILDYSFSGTGFDGKGITVSQFAAIYLSNELDLPVIDETGLKNKYDIKTNNDLRNQASILTAINTLGLKIERSERPMKVLIFYK